jgi:mannose-6-phosphate isomerase-like protein (cupin superfamily)
MNTIENYINSGILELYAMGITNDEESLEITLLSEKNIEIKNEIDAIDAALQIDAANLAPEIDPGVKPNITATINYMERLKKGEEFVVPPTLSKTSKIDDFKTWLDKPELNIYNENDEIDAKIISVTPEASTMIIWLKNGAPLEVHDKEYEHFLIVEGTCDITIGDEVNSLFPGDYLSIPLYIGHSVKVTSDIRCKIILQRVAA